MFLCIWLIFVYVDSMIDFAAASMTAKKGSLRLIEIIVQFRTVDGYVRY